MSKCTILLLLIWLLYCTVQARLRGEGETASSKVYLLTIERGSRNHGFEYRVTANHTIILTLIQVKLELRRMLETYCCSDGRLRTAQP